MKNAIYEKIKNAGKLPSPSGVALELLRLVEDEKATIDKITATVSSDPAFSMFVDELPDRLAAIEKAMNEQDLVALAKLTHQLKGSAGGYGFPSITDAAKVVESSANTDNDLAALAEQTRALVDLCRRARATAETS